MRMGTPRSLASAATSLISCGLRRLPGLSRSPWTPASRAARAILWMEVDVGDDGHRRSGHDAGQTLGGRFLVAGAAHDVGTRRGQGVDLRQGPVGVGRLGGRHRLHRDGSPVPHGYRAHVDPAGRSPRSQDLCGVHHPMLRPGPSPPAPPPHVGGRPGQGGNPGRRPIRTGWPVGECRSFTSVVANSTPRKAIMSQAKGRSLAASAW